jgi:hypothetical protein
MNLLNLVNVEWAVYGSSADVMSSFYGSSKSLLMTILDFVSSLKQLRVTVSSTTVRQSSLTPISILGPTQNSYAFQLTLIGC